MLRRLAGSKLLRVAVTIGLLAVVLSQLHLHTVVQRGRHANILDLFIAVLLVALALVIGVVRWHWLLEAADINLPLLRNGRIYLLSTFAGTFMPTTVGTDVVRAMMVARGKTLLARVAMSVIVDRLAALLGLVAVAWVSDAIVRARVPGAATAFMGWASAVSVIVSAIAVFVIRRGFKPPARFVPARVRRVLADSHGLLREYLHQPRLLASVAAASVAYQALIVLQLVFLARALHVDLSFSTAAMAFTIVTLVTLLPISIGGFGVREGTFVVLFATSSINATNATLISLLTVVTLFIASLPGAYFLARDGLSTGPRVTTAASGEIV